jgi:hypothetical protein
MCLSKNIKKMSAGHGESQKRSDLKHSEGGEVGIILFLRRRLWSQSITCCTKLTVPLICICHNSRSQGEGTHLRTKIANNYLPRSRTWIFLRL